MLSRPLWAPSSPPRALSLLAFTLLACCDGARYPNALRRSHLAPAAGVSNRGAHSRVGILVLIFTQRDNEQRRQWQRNSWLKQKWQHGELRPSQAGERPRVSWRYVYVMARDDLSDAATLDQLQGDGVTLSAVRESYAHLVYKTVEAVRWALHHVAFGALLKTDDDTIVHIGRAAAWLRYQSTEVARVTAAARLRQSSGAPAAVQHADVGVDSVAAGVPPLLYAGRVFNDSQVIRANFSKADLLHPEWFPDDFVKWAVPFESYDGFYYPPYCSGGGYMLGADSARRIVAAYDVRVAAKRPVVRVEDAFVGILAAESGVAPTNLADYMQDPPAGRRQDPSLFGGRILVHRVVEPENAFKWIIYAVKTPWSSHKRRLSGLDPARTHRRRNGGR